MLNNKPEACGVERASGSRPFVSIIVPFYNVTAEVLGRCAASIACQTYGDFEALFVDDGSDAGFAESAAALGGLDSRIRMLRIEHAGVSAARNAGIDAASGDYLAFCDADDELMGRFLEEAVQVAVGSGADMVCGGVVYRFAGRDAELPFGFGGEGRYEVVDNPAALDAVCSSFLSYCDVPNASVPDRLQRGPVAKLYRRSVSVKSYA